MTVSSPSEILGFMGGLLCSLSNAPQILKLYRSRRADGVSVATYVVVSIGLVFSIVYGALLQLAAIYVCNTIALLLAMSVVVLKVRIDREDAIREKALVPLVIGPASV